MTKLEVLSGLPGEAVLRIVPIEGGLSSQQATPLLEVLRALIDQWKEGGVVSAGDAELLEDGHFVAIAYVPAEGDVSGCTKDQLTHVLLGFENQLGQRMLNAPRLAVRIDGSVSMMNNLQFKELRNEGRITPETVVFDHLLGQLDELQSGRFETTVADSWYARIGAA
ncbi:hypothetical protein KQI84_00955 [bacterium]|nr:hypothetical protein [bacterium]